MTDDQKRILAQILDEAADILARLPEDVAEKLQLRHWLPDELSGSAIMLRDEVEQLW